MGVSQPASAGPAPAGPSARPTAPIPSRSSSLATGSSGRTTPSPATRVGLPTSSGCSTTSADSRRSLLRADASPEATGNFIPAIVMREQWRYCCPANRLENQNMQAVSLFAALFSVLVPAKMWYGVKQPVEFKNDSKEDIALVLTDFSGKTLPATGAADAGAGQTVDARKFFPQLSTLGTY